MTSLLADIEDIYFRRRLVTPHRPASVPTPEASADAQDLRQQVHRVGGAARPGAGPPADADELWDIASHGAGRSLGAEPKLPQEALADGGILEYNLIGRVLTLIPGCSSACARAAFASSSWRAASSSSRSGASSTSGTWRPERSTFIGEELDKEAITEGHVKTHELRETVEQLSGGGGGGGGGCGGSGKSDGRGGHNKKNQHDDKE
jgi:hypothetical protein